MRPSGPIRNVAGIRADIVTARDARGIELPASPCVQTSPVLLDDAQDRLGGPRRSDRPMSRNRGSPPKVFWMSLRAEISARQGTLQVAQKSIRTSLPRSSPSRSRSPSPSPAIRSTSKSGAPFADLERRKRLAVIAPRHERLVGPAGGGVGHVELASSPSRPRPRAPGCRAREARSRAPAHRYRPAGTSSIAEPAILVEIRGELTPGRVGRGSPSAVLRPVDGRFGLAVEDDPAGHRAAVAADPHPRRLAALDLDGFLPAPRGFPARSKRFVSSHHASRGRGPPGRIGTGRARRTWSDSRSRGRKCRPPRWSGLGWYHDLLVGPRPSADPDLALDLPPRLQHQLARLREFVLGGVGIAARRSRRRCRYLSTFRRREREPAIGAGPDHREV